VKVGLAAVAYRRIGGSRSGLRQRLGIAGALRGFSTDLIRTTFAAIPHRRAVMVVKVVALPVGSVGGCPGTGGRDICA
jgi:hypothetical protein